MSDIEGKLRGKQRASAGNERVSMEPMGSATWPVQPRGCAVEPNAKAKLVVAAAVSAAF